MKKILTSLIALTICVGTGAAFAEGEEPAVNPSAPSAQATPLTTKTYVDDGLKYVYRVASDAATAAGNAATAATNAAAAAAAAQDDVDDLAETVAGHTGQISDLQDQIDNLNLEGTTYAAGTGITIDANDNNKVSVKGLAATASDGKRYVYQNGELTELEVAHNWNPSVLTSGN